MIAGMLILLALLSIAALIYYEIPSKLCCLLKCGEVRKELGNFRTALVQRQKELLEEHSYLSGEMKQLEWDVRYYSRELANFSSCLKDLVENLHDIAHDLTTWNVFAPTRNNMCGRCSRRLTEKINDYEQAAEKLDSARRELRLCNKGIRALMTHAWHAGVIMPLSAPR